MQEDFIIQHSQMCFQCTKHIYSFELVLKLYILYQFNDIICFGVEFNLDNTFTL